MCIIRWRKTYAEHKMLRHLISMTYFYMYFNQFSNILECYEETTVRRPAAATHTHTHSHTNSCLQSLHKVPKEIYGYNRRWLQSATFSQSPKIAGDQPKRIVGLCLLGRAWWLALPKAICQSCSLQLCLPKINSPN